MGQADPEDLQGRSPDLSAVSGKPCGSSAQSKTNRLSNPSSNTWASGWKKEDPFKEIGYNTTMDLDLENALEKMSLSSIVMV
jgi:hypothetical protein